MPTHTNNASVTQNQKAHLANAYNELGKELSSSKVRVIGNYTLGKVIGEGAYGKVRLGTHRLTSTRVAIKQIPKAMSSSLTREIHHHRQLHHPHVTQMYEVIATESSIWIVTELCCGGELFDYLVEKGRLSELETRTIFGQLCLAVAYLHEKGIVHRDLKLENVLLDERCRVKLGDFGFTREFERGVLMETFCGTTGYASPEMLQGKKYLGPEVDVWSLGVILYCLLTGTLPFDDDDEAVMRGKVIKGVFEDPEWLSIEARDLIKSILVINTSERFTISQILTHPWFTSRALSFKNDLSSVEQDSAASDHTFHSASSELETSSPATPDDLSSNDPFEHGQTTSADGHAIHRNPSEITLRKLAEDLENDVFLSRPKARQPETVVEEKDGEDEIPLVRTSSNSSAPPTHTLRTPARTKRRSVSSAISETDSPSASKEEITTTPLPQPLASAQEVDFSAMLKTLSPMIFSTPLERELLNELSNLGFDTAQMVHSVLSDACDAAGAAWWMLWRKREMKAPAKGADQFPDLPPPATPSTARKSASKKHRANVGVQTDPASMMNLAPTRSAPQLAFVPATPTVAHAHARPPSPTAPSTPTRSAMLSPTPSSMSMAATGDSARSHPSTPSGSLKEKDREKDTGSKGRKTRAGSVSIMQRATTALEAAGLVKKKSAEVFKEKEEREVADEGKEREKAAHGHGHGHGLTSVVAAKLTKSPPHAKAIRDKEKERERDRDRDKERDDPQRPHTPEMQHPRPQIGSPWVLADHSPSSQSHSHSHSHSHAHSHSRLHIDSPPRSPTRARPLSPRPSPPTPANSPGVGAEGSPSPPPVDINGGSTGSGKGAQRNRASILTAFRLWFNEEGRRYRKGKRKADSVTVSGHGALGGIGIGTPPAMSTSSYRPYAVSGGPSFASGSGSGGANTPITYGMGTAKRRRSGSGGGANYPSASASRGRHRAQRASISSRRSSSVNSRRSSASAQVFTDRESPQILLDSPHIILDSPIISGRYGSHTPNSEIERGEYISSRPSSVRSFSMSGIQRHRKSPSASSAGSATGRFPPRERDRESQRAMSPMQRYHRRAGSGGSSTTTRVIRQAGVSGKRHGRSNSTASSVHSPSSSRPASWYDPGSDIEHQLHNQVYGPRSTSPTQSTPRRGAYASSSAGSTTTFVAQKRQGPFMSPIASHVSLGAGSSSGSSSIGRSSWKKSWGLEPPGWQTRTTTTAHLPVEVLAVSAESGNGYVYRDVISGRHSLNMGDESDWVDEDDWDDLPMFAGGLGQLSATLSVSSESSTSAGRSGVYAGSHHHQQQHSLQTAFAQHVASKEPMLTLAPAPRGHRSSSTGAAAKRMNMPAPQGKRQKSAHSPVERVSPIPMMMEGVPEPRSARRQLPPGRSGPAFRASAIQEEDEGEEE
ncbi:hypothetical protein HGRIS_014076 [Hohenbuehelia grisea]|uniref:Protein kinase domain-containing protein n=1 Tax=Hohenbuehelia grisea TaxID=104357 RepID=A0ABR3JSK1_9AGAR